MGLMEEMAVSESGDVSSGYERTMRRKGAKRGNGSTHWHCTDAAVSLLLHTHGTVCLLPFAVHRRNSAFCERMHFVFTLTLHDDDRRRTQSQSLHVTRCDRIAGQKWIVYQRESNA
jgi:hypothetical protein